MIILKLLQRYALLYCPQWQLTTFGENYSCNIPLHRHCLRICLVASEWCEPVVFSPGAGLSTGTNGLSLRADSFGTDLITALHLGSACDGNLRILADFR